MHNFALIDDRKFENEIDEKVLYCQFMESIFKEVNALILNVLKEADGYDQPSKSA